MSEFKELIKSFSKSREYVRDFFVYGFKTRDEFGGWSGRTYDNERRRLESWLWGYVRQDYTANGKNIYLSIDSNLLDTNPLYRVWKAKSFTDNDIMLHFYILDYLQKYAEQTADAITDGILAEYDVMFEPQTVRRKCNQYARDGMLSKEKYGKEVLYRLNPPFRKTLSAHPGLANALAFYQLFSPLGIVGNTIMDNASLKNKLFRVKHSFFVHTLEDEILLDLLCAIHEEKSVLLNVKSTKSDIFQKTEGVPLKIFISTRTGRRFLCLYLPNAKRFTSIRLDAVKQVAIKEPYLDYQTVKEHLENFEAYIITRLEREGKGGVVRRIAPDTYCYETDVFDANEMLPWIRSFLGRIIAIETDCPKLNQLFERDFAAMYRMYFGENAQIFDEDDTEDSNE